MIILDTVELGDELYWEDERGWTTVEQPEPIRTVGGALEFQSSDKIGGRPITLSGSAERGWLPLSTVEALEALANVKGVVRTLTLDDGRTFNVMFRYHDGKPVSSFPVFLTVNPDADDKFWIILRLMEVEV